METFLSGVTIGMGITVVRMRMILKDRQAAPTAPTVSSGAANTAGTISTAVRHAVKLTPRTPGKAVKVSGLYVGNLLSNTDETVSPACTL